MAVRDGGTEPVYVFEIDGTCLFKHYFQIETVFSELQEYYSDRTYRFEVPADEFEEVCALLREHYYEPVVVDEADYAEFCVVKPEYTEHAEILKRAVEHWTRSGYNFFLMQSPEAVETAVAEGADPITETELVVGL